MSINLNSNRDKILLFDVLYYHNNNYYNKCRHVITLLGGGGRYFKEFGDINAIGLPFERRVPSTWIFVLSRRRAILAT